MIILIHSSKTMRPFAINNKLLKKPELIEYSKILDSKLKSLSKEEIIKTMNISEKLAEKTQNLIQGWTYIPELQREAIDSFLGDIYSGLQISSWSDDDRIYANKHLRILSGLYGILKPLDAIYPYRLEMGYKFDISGHSNLYGFWGDSINKQLPFKTTFINLAAVEYSKVITDYRNKTDFITPKFLTISPKNGEPNFVVVHAKIARGAFARWLITNRINDIRKLNEFNDLGYSYINKLSTASEPVFVCKEFGGIGLSVRKS